MARQYWKPSNLLYPLPVILVSCTDGEGHDNVMTAAWAGTICSDPVMVSVSIRKERLSHEYISKTGEFVINLTTEDMAFVTDYMGVKSGRNIDKFSQAGKLKLTKIPSEKVSAPAIAESPVCLECKVKQVLELGSIGGFDQKKRAIQMGEQAARAALPEIKRKLAAYRY